MGLMASSSTFERDGLKDRFEAFIRDRAFPCVGAKSALSRGQLRVVTARDFHLIVERRGDLPRAIRIRGALQSQPETIPELRCGLRGSWPP